MMKSTYGTGCFALLNTGDDRCGRRTGCSPPSPTSSTASTTYALEGSIFVAGRGGAVAARRAEDHRAARAQSGELGRRRRPEPGRLSRAGLCRARRAVVGRRCARRDVRPDPQHRPAELARAALEAVCYQTRDLLEAMRKRLEGRPRDTVLRVDGGMVASDWTMQCLADILDAPVDRPKILETTALGAGLPCRIAGRRLSRPRRVRRPLVTRSALRAENGGGRARAEICRLARRRLADLVAPSLTSLAAAVVSRYWLGCLWIGSTQYTASGVSTGSISEILTTTASLSDRTSTHSSTLSGSALIS